MPHALRLVCVLIVVSLIATMGCGRSRRGRPRDGGVTPTGDGGRVPPPVPGPVEDGLAAATELANVYCPCQVMSGEYTSVSECLAEAAPDTAMVSCSRSVYLEMRGAELDAALTCRVDQLEAITACLGTMGCDALIECYGATTACPTSAVFDAYDSAVDSCVGGDPPPPPPGMCTPRSTGGGVGMAIFSGSTVGAPNAVTGACGGSSAADAVHVWNAPSAGSFTFDTVGSDFDTVLYLRDGSCAGTELGCNDDTSGTESEVTVTVTSGQVLYVVVDGFSDYSGNYVVNVRAAVP